MPKLCLNMIVKDEEEIIVRCLENMAPLVDAFVISDTGSEDQTIPLIREFIKKSGKPGIVTQDKWRKFGSNRTIALRHAERFINGLLGIKEDTPLTSEEYQRIKSQGDWYICFTDADNLLNYPKNFNKDTLTLDEYRIDVQRGPWSYSFFFAMKYSPFGMRRWKWREPLHEFIASIGVWTPSKGRLPGFLMDSRREGARSRDLMCYERDALILKTKIVKYERRGWPPPTRSWFYYAQSLKDAQRYKEAIAAYQRVGSMNAWIQERYISYLECGRLTLGLNKLKPKPKRIAKAMDFFLRAMDLLPQRGEAAFELAELSRLQEHFQMGYMIASNYVGKPLPEDSLFIDTAACTWKMYDVAAVCAFYTGRKQECKALELKALEYSMTDEDKGRILKNLSFCD